MSSSRKPPVFVNRRNNDRRVDHDPCKKLEIDLYHRKRRKSTDRRAADKSLADDYYAFTHAEIENEGENDSTSLAASQPRAN